MAAAAGLVVVAPTAHAAPQPNIELAWLDLTSRITSSVFPTSVGPTAWFGTTDQVIMFEDVTGWTWAFDPLADEAWTVLTTTGPSARFSADLVWDSDRGELVLFGGFTTSGSMPLGDTWIFDGSSWTQRFPATSPSARHSPELAWSGALDDVVLFGGSADPSVFADTWVWNGSNWRQVVTPIAPQARGSFQMTEDGADGIVLFGGNSASAVLGDTWVFDGLRWLEQHPAASPPPTAAPSMTFDPYLGVLIFSGSRDAGFPVGVLTREMWAWDGETWTSLSNPLWGYGPLQTTAPFVYDPRYGVDLFFDDTFDVGREVWSVATIAPEIVPVRPQRLLETRVADGQIGYSGPQPVGGQVVTIDVAGSSRSSVPRRATSVTLNITATNTRAPGFVTVWPCGQPRPLASNLNFDAGATVANLVMSGIGTNGQVCVFTSATADLVADIANWMPDISLYAAVTPQRLLETRATDGQIAYSGPSPTAGTTIELDVTEVGTSNIAPDALAVVLNVTVANAATPGFVTVWPCGAPRPTASNVNFVAGRTVANLAISGVGNNGRVCLFTSAAADLVADVTGYLPVTSLYEPLVPTRVIDTRTTEGPIGGRPRPRAREVLDFTLIERTSGLALEATAVVLNVTATNTDAPGFLTVWDCMGPPPTASNLNYSAGSTTPNLVIAPLGNQGSQICVYTHAGADIVIDLMGYFT